MSLTPPYTPVETKQKPSTVETTKSENKEEFLNKRILETSILISSLWLNPTLSSTSESLATVSVIKPTDYQIFIKEVLRRSRCSLPVLQATVYHLFRLQGAIKNRFTNSDIKSKNFLNCPKKTFLACLILSFKFNHDSSYNLKTWSKISGLQVQELKALEFSVLNLLDYRLNITPDDFMNWTDCLENLLNKIGQRHLPIRVKRSIGSIETDENVMKKVKLCV